MGEEEDEQETWGGDVGYWLITLATYYIIHHVLYLYGIAIYQYTSWLVIYCRLTNHYHLGRHLPRFLQFMNLNGKGVSLQFACGLQKEFKWVFPAL